MYPHTHRFLQIKIQISCVYIYIYTYTHVYLFVSIHVCVYIDIFVYHSLCNPNIRLGSAEAKETRPAEYSILLAGSNPQTPSNSNISAL